MYPFQFPNIVKQLRFYFKPYRGEVNILQIHNFERKKVSSFNTIEIISEVPANERHFLKSCNCCCLSINYSFYLKFYAKLY